MRNKQDAFGNWNAKTYYSTQHLDLPFFGLLLLQSEATPEELPNLLWEHTRLMFRPLPQTPFGFQEKETSYFFPAFAANKAAHKHITPFIITNRSLDGNIPLLAYQKPTLITLSQEKNTLPNQLSLFEEELPPLTQEEDFTHMNAKDLQCWNGIGDFLQRHSQPLSYFQYLLPLSIYIGERIYPFLIHLQKIPSIRFHFIPGGKFKRPELFYLFESYRESLG